jgi:hypothetical protein
MSHCIGTLSFLLMFLAGFGCGFHVRDRIVEKRRSRYLVQPISPQPAPRYPELNRDRKIPPLSPEKPNRQKVSAPQSSKSDQDMAALTHVGFDAVRVNDELQALLERLPRDGKKKGSQGII